MKAPIAPCPLAEAIEERLCVYYNEDCGEEELGDAQEQAIIDTLQVHEDHQDAETKQLTTQYNQLKERKEIVEKAMNILRDTAASIGRDIENTIRSQEQVRAKAQMYHDQKVSKINECRRNTINERLCQELSRRSRLISDIVSTRPQIRKRD